MTTPNSSSNPDAVLVGAGIMSATLAVILKELDPSLKIEIHEVLDSAAQESSNAWNNAGTGHAALCELNYTPQKSNGSIDISKALEVNTEFDLSPQLWAYLVKEGAIKDPQSSRPTQTKMGRDIGHQTEYKTKLTDSHTAVEQIRTNSIVGIGQAVCQAPALMQALAERAKAGKVDNVKVYYMHSEEHMKNSLLQYELMGRIKPYCMFMQATERALIKKGVEDGNRKVVYFVPNSFSQSIRFFTEHMRTGAPVTHPDLELDAFLVTVSPMDRHGYFTFGTNNDYTSTAARAAKRLIVEVNQHMPRVFGRSQLQISEVAAIVENDAALLAR